MIFQEVIELRARGWEGLPPPPIFGTGRPKPTGANQKDPAATPVITSLGLPSRDLAPQIPQSPPPEQAVTPEPGTTPVSLVPQSHPSASPPCPTSRSQIHLMTSPLSIRQLYTPMTPSTSRMGTSKCCVTTSCSVSMPVPCRSTLLSLVSCSRKRT
jgi:hypothetical protein